MEELKLHFFWYPRLSILVKTLSIIFPLIPVREEVEKTLVTGNWFGENI